MCEIHFKVSSSQEFKIKHSLHLILLPDAVDVNRQGWAIKSLKAFCHSQYLLCRVVKAILILIVFWTHHQIILFSTFLKKCRSEGCFSMQHHPVNFISNYMHTNYLIRSSISVMEIFSAYFKCVKVNRRYGMIW